MPQIMTCSLCDKQMLDADEHVMWTHVMDEHIEVLARARKLVI